MFWISGANRKKAAVSTALVMGALVLLTRPADAQIAGKPVIVKGTCDTKSGVEIDDGAISQFGCNAAMVVRTERGTVLVQFTDTTGDDGRMLGFGGVIEGRQGFGADKTQMLAVQRIYLGDDAPITADRGTCILNWTGLERTGGKLTSVLCGGVGSAEGSTVAAKAFLTVRP
jgi:hypothetical protein